MAPNNDNDSDGMPSLEPCNEDPVPAKAESGRALVRQWEDLLGLCSKGPWTAEKTQRYNSLLKLEVKSQCLCERQLVSPSFGQARGSRLW